MIHIGLYIKQKREAAGLSLAELARQATLSKGYLHTLEHGNADPSLLVLRKIAGVFGLGAGDLLVEAGYTMNPRPTTNIEVLVNGVKRWEYEGR